MQQNATEASGQLLPRYRRPLDVGAILDETFQIYRRSWLQVAGILAVTIVPAVLLAGGTGLLAVGGALSDPNALESMDPLAMATLVATAAAAGIGLGVVFGVALLIAGAAVTVCTMHVMHGERPAVWEPYRVAFKRTLTLLGAVILLGLGSFGLVIAAIPVFLLWFFPGLFGLTPLVALIVWVANPGARANWLKWLIILTTPWGLPIYFGVKWSLWAQVVVLEGVGPMDALKRSSQLIAGNWFRSAGMLVVISFIVSILQAIPATAMGIVAGIATAMQDGDPTIVSAVINGASSLIGYPLFGGLTFITLTILFIDLRNRHEGADLEGRVQQMETSPASSF